MVSREELRVRCFGNKSNDRIAHAFSDDTHNTCCELGPKSRAAADAGGNPIGSVSKRVGASFRKNHYNWSTCTGSAVCSEYNRRHGDANILFAVNPGHNMMFMPEAADPPLSPSCERWMQNYFGGNIHQTPGITNSNKDECSYETRERILRRIRNIRPTSKHR